MTATFRIFSYGTLRQANVQKAVFGRRLVEEADALVGFRVDQLAITDPDVIAKSGKTHHPILMPGGADDRVPGMVFEITAEELAAADAYEVADYKRVSAQLASGKTAWVYVKA